MFKDMCSVAQGTRVAASWAGSINEIARWLASPADRSRLAATYNGRPVTRGFAARFGWPAVGEPLGRDSPERAAGSYDVADQGDAIGEAQQGCQAGDIDHG